MANDGSEPHVTDPEYARGGERWCLEHPEVIFAYHQDDRTFLAVHKDVGVVISAEDEEEFQLKLSDRRPSVLRQLFLTCTEFWVNTGEA